MSDIRTLSQSLVSGQATSEALVRQTLATIEAKKSLNAFLSVFAERAQQKAQASDARRVAGKSLGVLDGVPIAIKDNLCLADTRTTCGSHILENFVAPYTATAVAQLEAAGAIVVGKTNMDEFAMGSSNETSYFGPVVNPQAPDRVPGGSSGGSAAAVASDCVPAALGSDTGGSIRQPAACCGVVGLKPTYGRVSRYGLVAYASSLDQIGPLGHTVEDCALLLNVLCGQDPHDNTTSDKPTEDFTAQLNQGVQGKVIGVPKEYFGAGLDPKIKATLEASLAKLEKEGAKLLEVSLPTIQHAISSYYIIATAEASSNLSRFDGVRYTHRAPSARTLNEMFTRSRSEGFGKEVQRRILLGSYVLSSGFYDAYYVQAQKVRRVITDDFHRAFTQCDVIASPTLPGAPLHLGEGLSDPMTMYLSDIYTVSLNLAGLPGLSVPCGVSDGLRVGLQLIGKPFGETSLLGIAAAVEKAAGLS
ncbi:MAG TPA: Asp-tRNA(Asn)/Glu-tRNA(Gln) amidotransferase subunit GatA [Fibrobacteraceae bacterium]|nr:Asp-tRNA(Asn)/Glu-tRNA(Gln) amidotransferase subunit GatA [Fibrobacteraceae bacterium]